jgi:quinolinate synthase
MPHERIRAAKAKLGKDAVLLCHHYQRADVYAHADITGDSLKLSRLAAQAEAKHIVFCGVHFMAEVADILSRPEQISILPDLAAGCSMADMASLAKVERAWRELAAVLDPGRKGDAGHLHQLRRRPQGLLRRARRHRLHLVERAQNPRMVLRPAREGAVLPRPAPGPLVRLQDGHPARRDGDLEPRPGTGRPHARADREGEDHPLARLLFGAPDVPAADIIKFRNQHPDGLVISHPECSFEVCKQSDYIGSTETILQTVKAAPPNTRWLVGTELNLVERLAQEVKHEGKIVQFMAGTICMCSTMQRIDPQHLAWTLENLVEGKVVNQISVPEHEAKLAKISLERMLAVS